MGVDSESSPGAADKGGTDVSDVVVGLDGSPASLTALRWAAEQFGPTCRLHVVHAVLAAEELALDAALGDSVRLLRHRDQLLREDWIPTALAGRPGLLVEPVLREGPVAGTMIRLADEVGAELIVVGHHAQSRLGPQLVGHVTATLLHDAERPIVVVPLDWDPDRLRGRPVAVGVGVSRGTEAAVRWTMARPWLTRDGLILAHAYGPRSVFRPDGWLDVLAYHLDPTVLPEWVEQDLLELADQVREEIGGGVDVTVSVQPGRTGAHLVEAGTDASLLVVGRGEAPFIRSHTIAPYLRYAIVHAPCPVVIVPAAGPS